MIEIKGFKFYIDKSILNRWCNEYGYDDIQELENKGDFETVFKIYCNTVGFFNRG